MEAARHAIRERADVIEARLVRASALGHSGRIDEAQTELAECRRIDPGFDQESADWHRYRSKDQLDHLLDGLRKAGLAD